MFTDGILRGDRRREVPIHAAHDALPATLRPRERTRSHCLGLCSRQAGPWRLPWAGPGLVLPGEGRRDFLSWKCPLSCWGFEKCRYMHLSKFIG